MTDSVVVVVVTVVVVVVVNVTVVVVVVVNVTVVVVLVQESQRTGQEFLIFSPLRGSSHSFGSYLSAQMIGSGSPLQVAVGLIVG